MTNKNLSSSTADCSTLVDLLRQRAHQLTDKTVYTFLTDGDKVRLTYGELDRQAQIIGARLQKLGATGERALLLYSPGLEYIAAFFGCLYAGVISVPVYPPRLNRPMPRLQAIVADSQATVALTTSQILAGVEGRLDHVPDLAALRWLATDDLANHRAEEWSAPVVNDATLAFLQYTSGSTAAPKGVMVSHGNLMHNQKMIQAAFGHTEHSTVVGWLPVYHDMGLIGNILQPLYLGSHCILMSPLAFLQQPIRWLQAITEYRAHTSGGPNFAYELCVDKIAPEQHANLDLSCWKVAFNGAEPVRPGTLERFSQAFEPCGFRREAFYPCYGLAEATLIVSGGEKSASPIVQTFQAAALEQDRVVHATKGEGSRALAGCGRTLLDQKIVVADPTSLTRCAPHHIGEIWVSGPSVARGYWNQPEETKHTFRARLKNSGEGPFLRTGDLGFLQDGELFVTGRLKDLIIVRGRNHYPQDIELTAEKSHLALRPGCGAAFSVDVADEERVVIVHEVKRTHRKVDVEKVARAIRQAVAEEHELHVYAVTLIKPGRIPKTSSGKIQRHACRARFLANDLNELGSSIQEKSTFVADQAWTLTSKDLLTIAPADRRPVLEAYLQQQVAKVAKIAPSQLGLDQPLSALGLDSLMAIELQHSLEAGLNVVVPMTSFLEGANVVQLASHILGELDTPSTKPATIAPPQEKVGEFPLSQGQRAIWFLHQLAPASAVYNIATAVRIRTALNIPALQRAFQDLVDRHSALRTTFSPRRDEPVQVVHEQMRVSFHVQDASDWDETLLNERLVKEAHTPFDLERDSPLRVTLFIQSPQECVLLLVVHHIGADFWSLTILAQELGKLYQAEQMGTSPYLAPLALQYSDYMLRQAKDLSGPTGERLWAYWQKQLSGKLPVLNLPTDYPRPPTQTYHGDAQFFELESDLAEDLKDLGRTCGATLYTTLLAAFQTLLYRYTGQKDILVGSPTSGRSRADLGGLVGYFVNPVVLRADLAKNPSFVELLAQVRQTVLAAFEHQDYPFALLTRQLQPERNSALPPIFQVMFVWQQAPLHSQAALVSLALGKAGVPFEIENLKLESIALRQCTVQFDLVLVMAQVEDKLGLCLQYNTDLFKAATIERLAGHFQTLLAGIAANPERRVSELPLLTQTERHQLLMQWNDTPLDYARDLCIHEWIEAQAEQNPTSIAAVANDEQLTYRALDQRANQLAHYLIQLGVGPDVLVGLCVERSLEMLVGLLGILKAGGAYVPLDPTLPQERLGFMMAETQIPLLLTKQSLAIDLPAANLGKVYLDADWGKIARKKTGKPDSPVNSGNLAYAIYTSGSSGKPKGVLISHQNLVYSTSARLSYYAPISGYLLLSPLAFDSSVSGIFGTLCQGGKLILPPEYLQQDVAGLVTLAANQRASNLWGIPSFYELMLTEANQLQYPELCCTVVAGEACPSSLVQRHYELLPQVSLFNEYGPTEGSVWCSVYDCKFQEEQTQVPIGRPIANTQLYILDAGLQLVPVGMAGELYLGGDGVGRGYLKRAGLTAEQFIPDPFSFRSGDRLYRTGDLVRYLPDGNIEFLGRIDHQVKLRGFRIELEEIETILRRHPAVQECAVTMWEKEAGQKRLVAYVAPTLSGQTFDKKNAPSNLNDAQLAQRLKAFLRQELPDYMVPATLLILKALPRASGGKINRHALPDPSNLRPQLETAYVAPRTELEQAIAAIWQKVLSLEKVGVYDNFFDLGGDSIISIQIISRLNQRGISVKPQHIFRYQTVAELAQTATELEPQKEIDASTSGRVDLTPIQRWFFEQELKDVNCFSQTVTLYAREKINVQALTSALQKLINHHDALRMRYVKQGSVWHQHNYGVGESIALEIIDLSEKSQPAPRDFLEKEKDRIRARLDITNGPLFAAGLFRVGENQSVFLACHHLVVDGVSWRILITDLIQGYEQALQGQSIELGPKTLPFSEWSKRLAEYAQTKELTRDLSYWESVIKSDFELSTKYDSTMSASAVNDVLTARLSSDQTNALLREANHAYRTTTNELLIVALARALHVFTGQDDVALTLEGHGRDGLAESENLSQTIGWFTTLFPVMLGIGKQPKLGQQIKLVKESLRQVPTKGLSFGVLKYLCSLKKARDILDSYKLPPVVFNYLGQLDGTYKELFRVGEFSGTSLTDLQPANHNVEINSAIFGGQLEFSFNHNRNKYRAEMIKGLADRFKQELETVISHCVHPDNHGLTPSDVSLLKITQSELDQLQAVYLNTPLRDQRIKDVYPLSPMQHSMLLYALSAPDSLVSFEQFGFTLEGSLHQEHFQRAWNHTIAQNPTLRTIFDWENLKQPVQIVLKENPSPVNWHDWSDLTQQAQSEKLQKYIAADKNHPFDLSQGPLVRISIFKLREQIFRCLLSLHHIISDGWSLPILIESIFQAYEALRQNKDLPYNPSRPYKDYVAWLIRQNKEQARTFWCDLLGDFATPTPLPASKYSGFDPHKNIEEKTLALSPELTNALKNFAHLYRITLNTLVQAVWAILLRQYSHQQEVVFGVAVSGRPVTIEGIEQMLGLFINNLPMRVRFKDDATLIEFLLSLQELSIEMRDYEYNFLPDIQAHSSVPTSKKLFDSLVVFQNYPLQDEILSSVSDLTVKDITVEEMTNYELTITIFNTNRLALRIQYNSNRFESAVINRILGHFETLFWYIILNPDSQLRDAGKQIDWVALPIGEREKAAPDPSPVWTPPQTALEKIVARVWQEILGMDEINIQQNYLNLSANSLVIATVHARLQETLKKEFPLVNMFQYPTIQALAAYLSRQQSEQEIVEQADEQRATLKKQQELIRKRMQK